MQPLIERADSLISNSIVLRATLASTGNDRSIERAFFISELAASSDVRNYVDSSERVFARLMCLHKRSGRKRTNQKSERPTNTSLN